MKQVIPIFFTVDQGYVPYLSVAMASLIEHASSDYQYHIHVIYESLTEDAMKKLKTLEKEHVKILFSEMKTGLESITNRKENFLRTEYFTLTIYFRLFLPSMFPEYDKAIYIDSDTCILGDISQFYQVDLGTHLFGGCKDISCQDNAILCTYFKENAGVCIDEYINSGVLLMNMKKLREVNFEQHFLTLLNRYHFDTVCPDQDYINAMAYGQILYLSNEWNAMPTKGKHLIKNPKIIHYNLFFKPWHYDNIDYADAFWKYANQSLFKEKIRKEKENYTKEKQLEDEKKFNQLIERTSQIIQGDTTFKSVFESGLEKRI